MSVVQTKPLPAVADGTGGVTTVAAEDTFMTTVTNDYEMQRLEEEFVRGIPIRLVK